MILYVLLLWVKVICGRRAERGFQVVVVGGGGLAQGLGGRLC